MALRLLLILGLLFQPMAGIGAAACGPGTGGAPMSCCAAPVDEGSGCCSPANSAAARWCCAKEAPEAPKPAPTSRTELGLLLLALPAMGFSVAAPDEADLLRRPASPGPSRPAGRAARPLLCIWLT